jgi:hypothetical protein
MAPLDFLETLESRHRERLSTVSTVLASLVPLTGP